MTDLITAACRSADPCGFEVVVQNTAHKDRVEDAHMDRWHAEEAPPTDELCEQIVAEHTSERDVIVMAFEATARMHGGRVDPDEVRGLIPPGITPQLIGAMYRVLRAPAVGALVPVDTKRSEDVQGRNVGKPATVYELRPDALARWKTGQARERTSA